MRALAILCVVPGFSLGLIAGATHLVGPLEPSAQRTNLVWSNRVFTTRKEFETWLVARGSNYELWSQRHPVAARHFEDASRSLATSASGQDSRPQVQSGAALLIAIISCSALLALLAFPRLVRSIRFLLEPPRADLRLRGPPPTMAAAVGWSRLRPGARAPRRTHAPGRPRLGVLPEAVHPDWRKASAAVGRLGQFAPGRIALSARSNTRSVRHYLPGVIFYATVIVLSFAIGAWIAIYL
jgi:hypothetical protein